MHVILMFEIFNLNFRDLLHFQNTEKITSPQTQLSLLSHIKV